MKKLISYIYQAAILTPIEIIIGYLICKCFGKSATWFDYWAVGASVILFIEIICIIVAFMVW